MATRKVAAVRAAEIETVAGEVTKGDVVRKITSRKFWVCVAAFLGSVGAPPTTRRSRSSAPCARCSAPPFTRLQKRPLTRNERRRGNEHLFSRLASAQA